MTETKVHLGCGRNYIPGWVNIDLFTAVKADVYADLMSLPFQQESVDVLYCSHLLEHVQRRMVVATLSYWRGLLKSGGILRLAVPDFQAVVEWYSRGRRLDDVMGLLYGGQTMHKNCHFVAFDQLTLERDLRAAGFETVRFWDWRKTEHAQYDDYSQCYLPHMDKEHGLLMSLNMEAVR